MPTIGYMLQILFVFFKAYFYPFLSTQLILLCLPIFYYLQKMDPHHTAKKKIEKKPNLKRSASTQHMAKNNKKKALKQSPSTASFTKTALTGSTFHTNISKSLPKKSTSKKPLKKKKVDKNKQNTESRPKQKNKAIKSKTEKIEQLTDRKKIHLEFFMYKDTYLPIENTEQRKIVYKINLIDQRFASVEKSRRDKMTWTEMHQTKNQATDAPSFIEEESQKIDFEIQTEISNRCSQTSSASFQNQKCFVSTLSELQFLYLPDQKNFEGFSSSQKTHYRDLFLFMAKKFQQEKRIFDESTIETMLSERECMQRGVTQSNLKKGIPTHTPSILSYLANLFFFVEIHEKVPMIDRINCNYGYSTLQKMSRLRHDLPTRRPSKLISETTFWAFEEEMHGQMKFESELIEESLHYHNKAIFDCVNEYLECFQPYYSSSGEPFPWNYNFETTFYCITEESFNALACQIKERVWESSTILAGLILDVQGDEKYKTHIHKILQNQRAMLMKEMKKIDNKVQADEERTKLLINVSEILEDSLIAEIAQFLLK